jgi:hypothetical protein
MMPPARARLDARGMADALAVASGMSRRPGEPWARTGQLFVVTLIAGLVSLWRPGELARERLQRPPGEEAR